MKTGFICLVTDMFASYSIQWGSLEMCLWPFKMTLQSTAFILLLLTEEIVKVIKSLQWDLWVFQRNFRTDILQLWSSQIKFHFPWLVLFAISSEMSYNHSTKLSPWLVTTIDTEDTQVTQTCIVVMCKDPTLNLVSNFVWQCSLLL